MGPDPKPTRRVKLADVIKAGLERLGLPLQYVLFKRQGKPELRVVVEDSKRRNDK